MSLDVEALIDAVRDLALETGLFGVINGHEPATPIPDGLDAAVWLQYIGPCHPISGLSATAAAVTVWMRVYSKSLSNTATPADLDAIDPAIGDATSQMIGLLSGDFTLGDLVFAVDLLGMDQVMLSAKAGNIDVSGTVYRIMDITIPLLIDAVWTQAPGS
ncbi:MAG TPA: hypothetical protein VHX38_18765 [Pseudonocardiaceae bacterium]|jgi:hypothetical protein|nr:hypothetical protein [Pseudonocardiaceae bacterium]